MRALALVMVAALALPGRVALADSAQATMADGGAPVDAGPADVPLMLAAGQPAPAAGWLLSDARARVLVAHEADCQASLKLTGETSGIAPGVILAGAGGLALGVAVGVVATLLIRK